MSRLIPITEDEAYDSWRDNCPEDYEALFHPELKGESKKEQQHNDGAMCEAIDRINEAVLALKQLGQWPEGINK